MLCFICVVSVKYRRDCRECWAHHKKYSGGKGFTPAFTGRSIPPPPPRPYVTQHNKISSGGSISGGISGERETEDISLNIGKICFQSRRPTFKKFKSFYRLRHENQIKFHFTPFTAVSSLNSLHSLRSLHSQPWIFSETHR